MLTLLVCPSDVSMWLLVPVIGSILSRSVLVSHEIHLTWSVHVLSISSRWGLDVVVVVVSTTVVVVVVATPSSSAPITPS